MLQPNLSGGSDPFGDGPVESTARAAFVPSARQPSAQLLEAESELDAERRLFLKISVHAEGERRGTV